MKWLDEIAEGLNVLIVLILVFLILSIVGLWRSCTGKS